MTMKLELVPVPVTDVDRAKAFYAEQVGFNVDLDERFPNGMRVVQLTPPGRRARSSSATASSTRHRVP